MPSYQTDNLTQYNPAFQQLAKDLFDRTSTLVGAAHCTRYAGSYSVTGATLPDVVGKIVIYQAGIGRTAGSFPGILDGVYVFVRKDEPVAGHIWTLEMQNLVFPQFFRLMGSVQTLGIAPQRMERFTYFRVTLPTDAHLVNGYSEQIALLLEACHRVC